MSDICRTVNKDGEMSGAMKDKVLLLFCCSCLFSIAFNMTLPYQGIRRIRCLDLMLERQHSHVMPPLCWPGDKARGNIPLN